MIKLLVSLFLLITTTIVALAVLVSAQQQSLEEKEREAEAFLEEFLEEPAGDGAFLRPDGSHVLDGLSRQEVLEKHVFGWGDKTKEEFAAEEQKKQQEQKEDKEKPRSWTRWTIDSMRSVSDSMEIAVGTMHDYVHETVGSFAGSTKALLSGEHALPQVRTTLPKEEREAHQKYLRQRQRDRSKRGQDFKQLLAAAGGGGAAGARSGGGLLSQDENFETVLSHAVTKEQRKKQLQGRHEGRSEAEKRKMALMDGAHRNSRRHRFGAGGGASSSAAAASGNIATGGAASRVEFAKRIAAARAKTLSATSNKENNEQQQQQLLGRQADTQAYSLWPASSYPQGYQDALADLSATCSGNLVLGRYDPNLNMSCWSAAVCNSTDSRQSDFNVTKDSRCYISAAQWIGLDYSNRSFCLPSEPATVQKFCLCPADRLPIQRNVADKVRCFSKRLSCSSIVTSPKNYTDKMNDRLQNSLSRAEPLRLPEAGTVDRTSKANVTIGATFNCSQETDEAARKRFTTSSGGDFTFPDPIREQLGGGPEADNTTLVMFLALSVWWDPRSDPTGSISYFEQNGYVYDRDISAMQVTRDVNGTTVEETVHPFLLSPNNFDYRWSVVVMQPFSFLHLSRNDGTGFQLLSMGANSQRVRGGWDTAGLERPSPVPKGLLVGQGELQFNFSADNLTDDYFAGGQLTVEITLQLRSSTSASIITLDVVNAPPPLPRSPAEPLEAAAIILIVIGCIAVVSGIVALAVGWWRSKKLEERKRAKALTKQRQQRGQSLNARRELELDGYAR